MASKIIVNLDTSKENYIVAKCKQNDDLTLEAFIYENGESLDLTNKEITIQALKADGTYIIQSTGITKENNKMLAELIRDFSRVPGTTKIEIVLVESSKQNTTFSFYLEVVGSVIRGAVQSSNTATILEALDNKIIEAGQVKQETEELVQSGGAATKGEVQEINASLEENTQELATTIKKQGDVLGGIIPTPFRTPTINVFNSYPTNLCPYIPCWIEGNTIYAYGRDNTLRKSTDGGRTFIKKGYNAYGFGAYDCFLKCKDGSLLNIQSATNPPTIQRSIDDGVTWTMVYTLRTNIVPLGSQSLCIDDNTGYIYLGEYNKAPTDKIGVIISKDNGATWQEFYMWEGENTTVGTPNRIRHVHAVQYDPIDKRIIICTGDSTDDTGLWRTTANGLGVEKIIVNSMLPSVEIDSPRSIGVMTFPNYIAWGADTTYVPYLFRIARSEIGKANPKIEKIYRLNSSAWFTCKAGNDNNTWLFSASQEGSSIDKLCHLYAVTDEGKTCWEVGSIATNLSSVSSSLQPVGSPHSHGDSLYLVTRGFDIKQVWNLQVSKGFVQIPRPQQFSEVLVQQTFNGVNMSVPPQTEIIFGTSVAGAFAKNLNVFECNVGEIDAGGTIGNLKIQIKKRSDGTVLYETSNNSDRYTTRQDMGLEISKVLLTGGDRIDFVIKNLHAGTTIKCSPSVTFGWGLA